jgi:hypothetical protein
MRLERIGAITAGTFAPHYGTIWESALYRFPSASAANALCEKLTGSMFDDCYIVFRRSDGSCDNIFWLYNLAACEFELPISPEHLSTKWITAGHHLLISRLSRKWYNAPTK